LTVCREHSKIKISLGPIAQLGERFNGIEEVMSSNLFRSIPQHIHTLRGKGSALKKQRSLLDDIIDAGREILERLADILNPDRKRRQPVRVPVPVRSNPQRK
jgi:hypothetical protein